jgi:hypothetical protein
LNLQLTIVTYVYGYFYHVLVASILGVLSMSTSKQRLGADARLAILFRDLANLKAQLSELIELRERVNHELRQARKSPKHRTGRVSTAPVPNRSKSAFGPR